MSFIKMVLIWLQKTNLEPKIIIFGFLFIFIVSFFLPGYFLPLDILHNFSANFGNQFFPPKNSLISDSITQFEPWRFFARQQLLSGIIPFWNPYNASGAPFFANPQTSIFFPLNFIYYFFPVRAALYIIPLLKLYLLGTFSYYYFRQIRCSRFASLFGALGTSFSAFSIVWLLWPHTDVFLFFPLLLFITEKLRNSTYRYFLRCLLFLVMFLALLGGHPETYFYTVLIYFIYSIFRLWKDKKELLYILAAFLLALCLDAFQIFPFLQYLFYSSEFTIRQHQDYNFYLPFKSIILDFIPFLLGAPQLQFYKPISDFTNFQETIGGYIGINTLLLAFFGIFTLQKNSLVKIWTILCLICFGISYLIPPFSIIKYLPVIHGFANQRLIGFYAFGMICVATITIEQQFNWKNKTNKKIFLIFTITFFLLLLCLLTIFPHFQILSVKKDFINFLLEHIIYMYLTTVVFIWILISLKKSQIKNFLLLILILSQTILLFWDYNPVTPKTDYYPQTKIIKKIQSLPAGTVLEVGNTFLPYNANIVYKISLAQNYDALEVGNYKTIFSILFPYLNTQGNVDQINMDAFKAIQVRYIVSDFEINLNRSILNSGNNTVLQPIMGKNIYNVSFLASENNIRGIRVLTANFNRTNTCKLNLTLRQQNEQIFTKQISCSVIHDHSFLYIPLNIFVVPHTNYTFSFSSENASEKNSVTLIGNKNFAPYFEIFYPEMKNTYHFKLLYKDGYNYLFEIPKVSLLTLPGKLTIANKSMTNFSYIVESSTKNILTIPVTKYPGWEVTIDGTPANLGNNVFLSVIVPSGRHIVSFTYHPNIFYLGLCISLLTFISLLIIAIRIVIKKKRNELLKIYKNKTTQINKNTVFFQHVIVFSLSFAISCLLFLLVVLSWKIKFTIPQTTAINWLTVHNYPKQQDTFYYIFGTIFVVAFTALFYLLWITFLIKKK